MLKKFIGLSAVIAIVASCGGNSSPMPNLVPEVEVIEFGEVREFSNHVEVDIRLPTTDTTLSGTLFLPLGQKQFPAVILQPGSQAWTQINTADYADSGAAYYNTLGIAAWSYDKRGVGRSGGVCCQGDIIELSSDVLASFNAIASHPQIDVTRIGIDGVSQGGWVAVNAAARSTELAFVVSKVGPAVSVHEEREYSRLTGDSMCVASGRSDDEIDEIMATIAPAGYDPRADLAKMNQPGIWFYGGLDTSIPVRQSITVLEELKTAGSKDWEIVLQPKANHFMVLNGGPCQADGPMVDNSAAFEHWFDRVVKSNGF